VAGVFRLTCVGRATDSPAFQKPGKGKHHFRFSMALNMGKGEKRYTRYVTVYDYSKPEWSPCRLIQKGELVFVEGEPWARGYKSEGTERLRGQVCVTAALIMRGSQRNTEVSEDNLSVVPEEKQEIEEGQEESETPF